MKLARTGRWLGAAATASVLAILAANPVAAQPGSVSIDISFPDVVVAAGDVTEASITIHPSEATTLEALHATFDFSGLAGIATVNSDSTSCSVTGTELECTSHSEDIGESGLGGLFQVEIGADATASAGDTGTLAVSVAADGIAEATNTAVVTVGAPVDLVADESLDLGAVEPGDVLSLSPTVRNDGPAEAQGVALEVFLSTVLQPETRHSNCTYYEFGTMTGVLCSFDAVLEPGSAYTLAEPLEIALGEDARAPGGVDLEGRWWTAAEAALRASELNTRGLPGEPGDADELTLVRDDGQTPAPVPSDPLPAADTDRFNSSFRVSAAVEGDSQPDFAALGAVVNGDEGDELPVTVGVENVGTATFDGSRVPVSANFVRVEIPEGTTAVEAPAVCSPIAEDGTYDQDNAGAPGEPVYACRTGFVLPAGERELFEFVLRIDDAVSNSIGLVEANQINPGAGPDKPEDIDPTNDVAEVVVNANGDGGAGGQLPVTGSTVAVVAGSGALLLLLGAATVLFARHRSTRFTA